MQHQTLESLILSLNGNEQRMLVRKLKQGRGDSNLLRLFNAVRSAKPALPALRSENVLRYQLFLRILAVLSEERHTYSEDMQLERGLRQLRILMERRLYSAAESMLQKLIALAEDAGEYMYLLQLYEVRLRLYHARTDISALREWMEKIHILRADTLKEMQLGWKLQEISYESFISLKTGWVKGERWGYDLVKRLKQIDPSALPTVKLKISWYQVMSALRFSRNETDPAYDCLLKLRELFHGSPALINRQFSQYLALMNNLNLLLLERRSFSEAWENIRFLESVKEKDPGRRVRIRERVISAGLTLLRLSGRFSEGDEWLHEAEYLLKGRHLSAVYRLLFRFDLCLFRMMRGEFAAAQDWLNMLLREPDKSIRPDIHACSRLLAMMLAYDTGDLKELGRLAGKFLPGDDNELLRSFCDGFADLSSDPLRYRTVFASLSARLANWTKDPVLTRKYLDNMSLQYWLSRKMGG